MGKTVNRETLSDAAHPSVILVTSPSIRRMFCSWTRKVKSGRADGIVSTARSERLALINGKW
jgi:hypothetical protein